MENLNFLEIVKMYRKMFDAPTKEYAIVNLAKKIFQEYFGSSGDSSLNISYKNAKAVRDSFSSEDFSKTLFDEAYDDILLLLERDSFFRFRLSHAFKDYVGSTSVVAV